MLPGLILCIGLTKLNTFVWLCMRKNLNPENVCLCFLWNEQDLLRKQSQTQAHVFVQTKGIVYLLSLFLCPKIPQKRLVSASGTLFWPLATTHTNLLQLSCEFRWSHPARPEEAQWKVKEWKRITLDTTALPYISGKHHTFTLPDQTCSWYIWTVKTAVCTACLKSVMIKMLHLQSSFILGEFISGEIYIYMKYHGIWKKFLYHNFDVFSQFCLHLTILSFFLQFEDINLQFRRKSESQDRNSQLQKKMILPFLSYSVVATKTELWDANS